MARHLGEERSRARRGAVVSGLCRGAGRAAHRDDCDATTPRPTTYQAREN